MGWLKCNRYIRAVARETEIKIYQSHEFSIDSKSGFFYDAIELPMVNLQLDFTQREVNELRHGTFYKN